MTKTPNKKQTTLRKEDAANERATELFLESGVLNPLRDLSNVQTFSLMINTFARGGEFMEPKEKHLKIIGDLQAAIEKNWLVKQRPQ